jgi:hypothetical protein
MKAGFWILWGFDALAAAVVYYFFFAGLFDGTAMRAIGLWLLIVAVLAGVLIGSPLLRSAGHPVLALIVLSVVAVPAFCFGAFFLLIILMKPRWN